MTRSFFRSQAEALRSLLYRMAYYADIGMHSTDAKRARDFGAQGIGLCRTEHMFFEEDRIISMREMILAAIWDKPWGHSLAEGLFPRRRMMSEIGG